MNANLCTDEAAVAANDGRCVGEGAERAQCWALWVEAWGSSLPLRWPRNPMYGPPALHVCMCDGVCVWDGVCVGE
jgi:hypothetical protein